MQVTRITEARSYDAPEHYGMACLRLQGKETTSTKSMWVGLSYLMPGGNTSLRVSLQEKIYVVIEGEVTISTDSDEATLGPMDSCVIEPGEARALENRTNHPATVLLVMQEAAPKQASL